MLLRSPVEVMNMHSLKETTVAAKKRNSVMSIFGLERSVLAIAKHFSNNSQLAHLRMTVTLYV